MRRYTVLGVLALLVLLVPVAALLLSCGGGGGSGSGSSDGSGTNAGTVSISVTDAKPKLPDNVKNVFITFDEVQVHKAGGGWISLPVVAPAPHTIDLLQFSNGTTTQLVPPVRLESGKYTQVRIVVSDARLVTENGDEFQLIVPSGKLKTDKDFDFEVHGGGAVDLVVDFDLSQSIVVTGGGSQKFMLKPVLHIVETLEAATIQGSIPEDAFGSATEATVTVWWDKDTSCNLDENVDEIYTQVVVEKADPNFEIFWLVPNEAYIVQIDVGGSTFFFTVPGTSGGVCQKVQPGVIYALGLATIQGSIAPGTFGGSTQATVTVLFDPNGDGLSDPYADDKEFTQATVTKPASGAAAFSISVFPSQPYVVKVEVNSILKYQEAIPANKLPAGTTFQLNGGNPI
ncbi:MAG TPA: DUF4382 domain-containing protein [Syntrophobacteria bacterium]|nr:DUF4382 domain-containing protein [Syntrophobacteria bacterium]